MKRPELLPDNLRELLSNLLAGTSLQQEQNKLVAVCHAISVAIVRRKVRDASYHQQLLGLKTSDLAYDCIADLFARNERGEFLYWQSYFAAYPLHQLTDEEILAHLRRLIASRVHQALFHLYEDFDPSLGKILRNVKLAVQGLSVFEECSRLGEPCLQPTEANPLLEELEFDAAGIEQLLHLYALRFENIPTLLSRLALALREQEERSRRVRLMAVALGIRSFYTSRFQLKESTELEFVSLDSTEIRRAVSSGITSVRESVAKKYSETKSLSSEVLEVYFNIIQTRLLNYLANTDGNPDSLWKIFQQHLPQIGLKEYKDVHRSRLEYLSRLVQKQTLEELRK
jgi:hypothetical protein